MSDFYIDRINSCEENAKSIIELTSQGLRYAGLADYQIVNIANPESQDHIERQIVRLRKHPERYLGAIAIKSGELIGFSKTSEWTAGNQLPFSSGIEKLGILAVAKLGNNRLNGEPFGIHGLVVNENEDLRQNIINKLIDRAIEVAESREVRIAQYANDPIEPSLRDRGFVPTEKCGMLVGLCQRLYIRPPYVPVVYAHTHNNFETSINFQ